MMSDENEIICECGHTVLHHQYDGCFFRQPSGLWCACRIPRKTVIEIAALRALVKSRTEALEKYADTNHWYGITDGRWSPEGCGYDIARRELADHPAEVKP